MKYIKLFEDYNNQVSLKSVIELIEYVYYFNYDEEDENTLMIAINDLKKLSINSINDLKKNGFNQLYRGISIKDISNLNNDKLPIVSWTYNKDTAEEFAKPNGIVLYEDIDNLDVILSIKEFSKLVKEHFYNLLDYDLQDIFDNYISEDYEYEVICFSKNVDTNKFYKPDFSLALKETYVDYTDQYGKKIVWEKGDFSIAISDDTNPSRISLWNNGKNIGNLYLGEKIKFENEYYRKVSSVDIDKKFRGIGLSTELYRVALKYITDVGIISYLPDRINKKQVPNIYKRLNGEIKGDFAIIRKSIKESLLLEKSIQDINDDSIFSANYKNNMRREDVYNHYQDEYIYLHGLDDSDEINMEEYDKWFFDMLENNWYDFSNTLDNIIDWRNGTVKIWRVMKVDDNWINQIKRGNIRLGVYWAWEERAAEAHWGDYSKSNTVLIESEIKEEYVDWLTTIHANIHPNYDMEKEITLYKNTPLRIVRIEMNNEEVDPEIFTGKIYKA